MWAQTAGNAGWELAARYAAAVAAEAYIAHNFNGLELIGSDSAPVVPIHPLDRPTRDERNAAIGLRHSPVSVNSNGNMAVIWAVRPTSRRASKDAKLKKLSARLTLDYYIYDLANTLTSQFAGKKIKTSSPARTGNATTPPRWKRRCTVGRSASTMPISSTGPKPSATRFAPRWSCRPRASMSTSLLPTGRSRYRRGQRDSGVAKMEALGLSP